MTSRASLDQRPSAETLAYLLGQVALRDERAFAALYRATSAHLLGVAMMVVRRRERAEEVLQEAYVNVWNGASQYAQTDASPMSWLISIVRHKALDHLRAGRRHEAHASLDAEDGAMLHESARDLPDPLALLATASAQLGVRECLERLDPPLRQSLALAYYGGMSHSEVSRQLRAPLGTVKAWLKRGVDRLRSCLDAIPKISP